MGNEKSRQLFCWPQNNGWHLSSAVSKESPGSANVYLRAFKLETKNCKNCFGENQSSLEPRMWSEIAHNWCLSETHCTGLVRWSVVFYYLRFSRFGVSRAAQYNLSVPQQLILPVLFDASLGTSLESSKYSHCTHKPGADFSDAI